MSKTKEVSTIIKPSEFFKRLDLSKLDANTAQYVREEILSFDNTDLLDGTPEFQAVREMIEENYPQALGIIPVPEKVIDETKKTEPVKKTVTGKVNKKEQERLKKEEQKAAKEKHKQEVEEIEGLIELMQDTVKANPKDEDSKDYLELLQDTIKELKKKKFEEGGEVDDNDDAKLQHIGSLIKEGNTSGYDPFWKLDIQFDGDIDDSDREHISKLVSEGYTSGEIVSGEESQRGWWSIEIGMEKGGKIPFKHRFIFEPKRKPDVIITGDIVEKISETGTKTTHVTINGYYYKTINPLSKKPYRALFVRKHYGILYHEKFKTFEEAANYLRTQSKHILSEIDKAERLEKSEIEYVDGGALYNKDLLPPIMVYSNNLDLAVSKFGITKDEARDKYGKYTIGQWEELLGGGGVEDIISNEMYLELDKKDDWEVIREEKYKDKDVYLTLSKSGDYYRISVKSNGKIMPKMSTYFTKKQSAENNFNKTIKSSFDNGGGVGKESNSEYLGKYIYKYHEERGEISASVEDMATGNEVWSFKYPDYSLPEEDREFQSTPVSDGFIRHWEDILGLENYLKDLSIIPADGQLLSESEANKIGYYGNGGAVANEIGEGSTIMFTHEGVPHKGEVEEVTGSGKLIVGYLDKLGQVLVDKKQVISIVPKGKDFENGGGIKKWYEQGGEIKNYDRGFVSLNDKYGHAYKLSEFEGKNHLIGVPVYKDGTIGSEQEEYDIDYRAFDDAALVEFKKDMDVLFNGQTYTFKKGGAVSENTTFLIGDVLQNKKHKKIYVTVLLNKNEGRLLTCYDSDKKGKGVTAGNWVRSIWDSDFNEWKKVAHVELNEVSKEFEGKTYSYRQIDNKDIDTYLAVFDDRYKFFTDNAPKALRDKFDSLENDNHHFASAKLVSDFFKNPTLKKVSDYKFKKGGKIEKEFIKKVKAIHEEMKEVTLKDGTKIDAKDLMAKGGAITNKERVEIVLKHYLIAALWSSTDSDNEDTPFDTDYSVDDFDKKTVDKARKLIVKFMMDNEADLKASGLDDEQIGHDLWLTQVGHGAGFWDRQGVSKEVGERLSNASKNLGQSANLYAEKGKVYIDGLSNPDEMAKGGGVESHKPEHYRYLTLQKVKGGLKVSLNKEGIEEVKDLKSDNKSDTDIWFNLFEDVHGNSEYIFHSDMGESGLGMTSAEGITDGYHYEGEDRSNLYKTDYPESAKVYWFPNYMVESSLDTMIEDGKVLFTEAESMKLGGQTKAGIKQDKNIKALHAGKRKSADGNIYYENRPNRSDKNRTKKFNEGGNMEGWTDIKDIVPAKLKVEKTTAFGNPEYLNVMYNGKRIARFYYNMKGYNQDFSLKNKEGVHYGFGGDKSESRQFSDFKSALREGFTLIK